MTSTPQAPSPRATPRRRFALLAAWLAAALASSVGSAAEAPRARAPVRIELRASVEVTRSRVSLGDVAILTGKDPEALRRLAGLSLGNAPRPGEAARLDRAELTRWIRARTGMEASDIEWAGPRISELRATVRGVSGDAIAARAAESVRAELSREGRRVELRPAQQPRDVTVPAGAVELKVRPLPRTAVVPKRLSAWVDVWVDGRFVRTVPVSFEVAAFGPAYVAAKDQPAGEVLDASALEVREVDWSGRPAPPVAPATAGPMRLRRPLSAGEAVTRAQVEPAPLVTRGGWATLRATQGTVMLESRVEVLQDGRAGQSVQVKASGAQGAILARVTGPGAVEVGP